VRVVPTALYIFSLPLLIIGYNLYHAVFRSGLVPFCGYALVRPFSYLRPFLYFHPPTLLLPKLYFDLNLTSTFCHNFTSTFLSQLYFDLFDQTLLRPKLYFDLCFSTNKKSRFDKRSRRSTKFEVQSSKYTSRSNADEVDRSK